MTGVSDAADDSDLPADNNLAAAGLTSECATRAQRRFLRGLAEVDAERLPMTECGVAFIY